MDVDDEEGNKEKEKKKKKKFFHDDNNKNNHSVDATDVDDDDGESMQRAGVCRHHLSRLYGYSSDRNAEEKEEREADKDINKREKERRQMKRKEERRRRSGEKENLLTCSSSSSSFPYVSIGSHQRENKGEKDGSHRDDLLHDEMTQRPKRQSEIKQKRKHGEKNRYKRTESIVKYIQLLPYTSGSHRDEHPHPLSHPGKDGDEKEGEEEREKEGLMCGRDQEREEWVALSQDRKKRYGIIHRLDTHTSGKQSRR